MAVTATFPSATLAAVSWVQSTLLGSVATISAIIAVAGIGLMMLSGRVDMKRGGMIVLGCFVIFGASSIAAGLRQALPGSSTLPTSPPPIAEVLPPMPQPTKSTAYDPYAGAAVPQNR